MPQLNVSYERYTPRNKSAMNKILCIGDNSITSMIVGIVVGLVGIAMVSVNYFIYKKLLAKGKQKYGSDIIRLAQEIAAE